MIHTLVGILLCMVLPGAALWCFTHKFGDHQDFPEGLDAALRGLALVLLVLFLLTLTVVGVRCMIWGFW